MLQYSETLDKEMVLAVRSLVQAQDAPRFVLFARWKSRDTPGMLEAQSSLDVQDLGNATYQLTVRFVPGDCGRLLSLWCSHGGLVDHFLLTNAPIGPVLHLQRRFAAKLINFETKEIQDLAINVESEWLNIEVQDKPEFSLAVEDVGLIQLRPSVLSPRTFMSRTLGQQELSLEALDALLQHGVLRTNFLYEDLAFERPQTMSIFADTIQYTMSAALKKAGILESPASFFCCLVYRELLCYLLAFQSEKEQQEFTKFILQSAGQLYSLSYRQPTPVIEQPQFKGGLTTTPGLDRAVFESNLTMLRKCRKIAGGDVSPQILALDTPVKFQSVFAALKAKTANVVLVQRLECDQDSIGVEISESWVGMELSVVTEHGLLKFDGSQNPLAASSSLNDVRACLKTKQIEHAVQVWQHGAWVSQTLALDLGHIKILGLKAPADTVRVLQGSERLFLLGIGKQTVLIELEPQENLETVALELAMLCGP